MIPVDVHRCQTEKRDGSFMTLGPRTWTRCSNPATVVAVERTPGEDGKTGGMSMCDDCLAVAREKLGDDYFTAYRIVRRKS